MNWAEHILRIDHGLTPTARDLVNVIAKYFSQTAFCRCQFDDLEAGALIGVSPSQVKAARLELGRKGFLISIHSPVGKPRYGLRYGAAVKVYDDGQAA